MPKRKKRKYKPVKAKTARNSKPEPLAPLVKKKHLVAMGEDPTAPLRPIPRKVDTWEEAELFDNPDLAEAAVQKATEEFLGIEGLLRKYPPRRKGKIYRLRWAELIQIVVDIKAFHEAHLTNLDILCGLYEELEVVNKIIQKDGHLIKSHGMVRTNPAVPIQRNILKDIQVFTKLLGMTLGASSQPRRGSGIGPSGEDEWS